MNTVPLGFGDQVASIPSHLCLFHNSDAELQVRERDFLQIALADPQQGAALFGAPGVAAQLQRNLEVALDRSLEDEVRRGRLVLIESDPDPDAYLERFRDSLEGLHARGYLMTRGFGRATWDLPGFPAREDHLWLESQLNALIEESQTILLCAYDVTTLPEAALAYGGLETHPRIVLGGRLIDNPSFVDASRYFADRLLRLPWLAPP